MRNVECIQLFSLLVPSVACLSFNVCIENEVQKEKISFVCTEDLPTTLVCLEVSPNLAQQMKCSKNPLNLFHVSSGE